MTAHQISRKKQLPKCQLKKKHVTQKLQQIKSRAMMVGQGHPDAYEGNAVFSPALVCVKNIWMGICNDMCKEEVRLHPRKHNHRLWI